MTSASLGRLLASGPSFTTRQAAAAGVDPRRLTTLVRRGDVIRLAPGVYAAPQEEETAVGLHVRRTRAILQRLGHSALASHHSALALLRLPLIDVDLSVVHLTYRTGRGRHRRGGYQLHPCLGDPLSPEGDAVGAAAAVVGAGLLSGRRTVLVAGDAALHHGLTTRESLADALHRRRGAPGIAQVRAAVAALSPCSESPGESLLRDDMAALGVAVEEQPLIACRGRMYRPDFRIVGTRVLIEFDGIEKYAGASGLRAEKGREEALRADGWIIVRFMWQDLGRLAEIRRRLDWALAADAARR